MRSGRRFFGGPDWETVAADIENVPRDDRSRFVLCLFMVVLTDQALYTYFRTSYETWRRRTNFPKFGWSGFGPHNENPFKILYAPERANVVDTNNMLFLVRDFVSFFVDETVNYFAQHLPEVEIQGFFDAIQRDNGYAFNEGLVVPNVKAEFKALIEGMWPRLR